MSAVLITLLAIAGTHAALVVVLALTAVLTKDGGRREAALTVLQLVSPALVVKLGPLQLTRGNPTLATQNKIEG